MNLQHTTILATLSQIETEYCSNSVVLPAIRSIVDSFKNREDASLVEGDMITLCNSLHQLSIYEPSISHSAARMFIDLVLDPSAGKTFSLNMKMLGSCIGKKYSRFIVEHSDKLDSAIDGSRDRLLAWPAVCIMRRTYLMRKSSPNGPVTLHETPQQMFMRVAVQVGYPNVVQVCNLYDRYSRLEYTQASPTIFNACLRKNGLTSCFLSVVDDNMESIASSYSQISLISARGGGMGYSVGNIRHSSITNAGESKGVVDLLKTQAEIFKYIVQGGRRRASGTPYLPLYHIDIEKFVVLATKGPPDQRIHTGMTFGLWMSDLFMERVVTNDKWTLFCPNHAPGLTEVYGDEFKTLYEYYEKLYENHPDIHPKVIRAQELAQKIALVWMETGTPYVLLKDAINRRNNQSNLGTIKTSNLCVSSDTKILTKEFGHVPIGNVTQKEVTVWNGREWSKVTPRLTSIGSSMMEVTFASGRTITCTEDHRFYIKSNKPGKSFWIRAALLSTGLELEGWRIPKGYEEPDDRVTIANIRKGGATHTDVVESTRRLNGSQPTFCLTEPKRNRCMFNGIVTGQCTEIVQYADKNNIASCNLGSIALPKCIQTDNNGHKYFDFTKLGVLVEEMVRNIDNVIDLTFYIKELPQIENCNKQNRPMGIGVQGLADVFILLDLPWECERAKALNSEIFETMYYHAVNASISLAKKKGAYTNFYTSPASKGWFQFDLCDRETIYKQTGKPFASIGLEEVLKYQEQNNIVPDRYNWTELREKMVSHGMRNSLLIALMPTASSSTLLGNRESFEPYPRNVWKMKALSDEIVMVNKHLVKVLSTHNCWTREIVNRIVEDEGSIQNIHLDLDATLEREIKDVFKCAPEIKQVALADMMLARQRWIDQAQSYNWFFDNPTPQMLLQMLIYVWRKGAKNGIYYLRTKPKISGMTTTRTLSERTKAKQELPDRKEEAPVVDMAKVGQSCSLGDKDCISCSS